MKKKPALLILVLVALSIYSAANIEKHPNDTYIIKNYNMYEEKQVILQAIVLDVEKNNDRYIINANTAGTTYRILVNGNLLNRVPQTGDLIEYRAISHLGEGYVIPLDAYVRTSFEHKFLFIRSLSAIPIILLFLWRERDELFGGT